MIAVAASPPRNHLVRPVSGCVTAVLIVWCFCGWIIDKGWTLEGMLLATMTGVFQALGFNASVQMRRAAGKSRERAKKFWLYVLAVTAGWTAFAAHHAYTVIVGEVPPLTWDSATWGPFVQSAAALLLLAAAATFDPLLGWAIEDVEYGEAAKPAEETPPISDAAKPAPLESQGGQRGNPAPPRSRPRLVERVAAGVVVAASPAAANAAEHAITEPAADKAVLDMLARDKIIAGVAGRNALIRAVPGLTKARAAELLDELAPGWRVKAA